MSSKKWQKGRRKRAAIVACTAPHITELNIGVGTSRSIKAPTVYQPELEENLENDALLATDTGAAPQRACSLKRTPGVMSKGCDMHARTLPVT